MTDPVWLKRALSALQAGEYASAHQLAMQVLQRAPETAEAYFVMAWIAHDHGKYSKAEEVVRRALRFAPDHLDSLLLRARCLLGLNRQAETREILATLEISRLTSAFQSDSVGVLFSRLGEHHQALAFFQRATSLQPEQANYHYNLGSCLQFSGQFDGAEAAYERAIALQPDHYRSHSSLSQLRRQTRSANHLPRLQVLWDKLDGDPNASLHIGHALAKEHEDLQEYQQAMAYWQAAKARKRTQIDTNPARDQAIFYALETLAGNLPGNLQWPSGGGGFESSEPIFVVGMPRTGTTLVERILASHSAVSSAGELANFSLLVKRSLETPSAWVLDPETLARAGQLNFEQLGRDYIESTRPLTGYRPHFIDKMPLNFMYIPLIAQALPKAKIICLRRNPMDTCLSNFRQLFSTENAYYQYAYSLEHTAEFFVGFDRVISAFQQALGARLYQVHYEQLVYQPERQAEQLLAYCGLPWESECLAFHQNATPVATASSVQVREPVYRRAVNRWRNYEPWLQPVKTIFERHGISYS